MSYSDEVFNSCYSLRFSECSLFLCRLQEDSLGGRDQTSVFALKSHYVGASLLLFQRQGTSKPWHCLLIALSILIVLSVPLLTPAHPVPRAQ